MSTQQMRIANYKDEEFTISGNKLLQKLETFASDLESNMLSNDKSFIVSKIPHKKIFDELFISVIPNYHAHKTYKNEHNGLYAFALVEQDKVNFQYIGISRTIRRRFLNHTRGKAKSTASWAFLMAQNDELEDALKRLSLKQLEMQIMRFTFIHIDNPFLRHMAEVYCANKLKSYWNTFETH